MNKKVDNLVKKEIDDKEDLEIKNIAYLRVSSQKILLYVLIFLFVIMLGTSIMFIKKYYVSKELNNNFSETIEINNYRNNVLITNNGEIKENITNTTFKNNKEYVIERVNAIKLTTNEKAETDGIIKYDVKYNIEKNDFLRNEYSTNDSEVLVRFSYSFDNEEWIYINNVISTTESTLNVLMGNYYDISGMVTNLKIATNYEMSSAPGETITMYWRSETIFKNKKDIELNKNIEANFKLEYKGND